MNNSDKDKSIMRNISELKSLNGQRINKYRRNFRYYNASANATLENMREPSVVGYYNYREFGEEADTSGNPQLNVIASCIDTLTSKIAESKVRPYFNTVNGSFADIQLAKGAQQFFDIMFDDQDVNKIVSDAFRSSCIFDTGVIYIDEETATICRALPFQVYTRPSEVAYDHITRVLYERKDYPVTLLPEKVVKEFKNKNIEYVDYGIYYDIFNHIKAYTANGKLVLTETYEPEVIPFVFLYYKHPMVGSSCVSVVDMLYTIQTEINILMAKIKDASQLNPAMTFLVPEGSNIKASQINNRIGNIIQYKPTAAGGTPVTSCTPPFLDGQYMATVNELITKAYDMVGISELSAQGKNTMGAGASGIALGTMEDIQGSRFTVELNQVIHSYVNIAKTCIKVFPKDADILPKNKNRANMKWSDIIKESDNFSIQYSAADALSKDPSTKLQQLQQLAMSGVIPQARIPSLMQLPDLEMGYSLSNNAMDAVMETIKECIEKDNFDVPEYIPFQLLKEEIINTQLSLKGSGKDNDEDIKKLTRLYEIVEDMEAEWTDEANAEAQQQGQQQGQATDGATLPQGQNILESEANMQKVTPDMDVNTQDDDMGSWVKSSDYDRA